MSDSSSPRIEGVPCELCGRRDCLDAMADDDVWQLVSAATGKNRLCLWCMDDTCLTLGIRSAVSLHFAGRALHGKNYVPESEFAVRRRFMQHAEAAQAELAQCREKLEAWSDLLADAEMDRDMANAALSELWEAIQNIAKPGGVDAVIALAPKPEVAPHAHSS